MTTHILFPITDKKTYFEKVSNKAHEVVDSYNAVMEHVLSVTGKSCQFDTVRGIRSTTTVFRMVLLQTRNLDAAIYHAMKATCYYFEFVAQMSNDKNNLLKLNSRDAVVFVLKKSVFDLRRANSEPTGKEKKMFVLLDKAVSDFEKKALNKL